MIDVLVPVLRRSPLAMLRSLEYATSEPFKVFFLCSPGDSEQIADCEATGHTTWVMDWEAGRADFAKKINYAFAHTDSEWLFQAADDIRFSPGWDTEALTVARKQKAQVIGTNDLHNPAVKAKSHATHILFTRAYIEHYGGTFDNSGAVFSEVYDHCYVDNEFIELAKRRRQWAFAERSVVEHLHPVWGLTEWDPTYKKAFREFDADRQLFSERFRSIRRARR
jgi:hypothetical protein